MLVPSHAHEWYPISWFGEVVCDDGAIASWSGEPGLWACSVFYRCAATKRHVLTPYQRAEREGRACTDHMHRTREAKSKCRRAPMTS